MDFIRRMKQAQSAQGMVEFALVLPILLLVILGVIAFGHLFFVYSTVVGASREAARWGAAVGEAPSGAPRYQDCGSIRSTAIRTGAFAGVRPESVSIDFDHGPVDPPPAPVFANCPLSGTGPDSTQVSRGDRIVVRVTVNYTPIVPLVNLPSFPLTAETARTIVKSVPVGEAPAAIDPCVTFTTTSVTINPVSNATTQRPVTGQPVTFSAHVTADDFTVPTGTVEYIDSVGNSRGPLPLNAMGQATFPPVTFQSADPDPTYSVLYMSDNTCHISSGVDDQPYEVFPATTTLAFEPATTLPRPVNMPVVFTVRLSVVSPGSTTTGGPLPGELVTISAPGAGTCDAPLTPSSGGTFTASCQLVPTVVTNTLNISASYPGNASYLSSSAATTMQVTPAAPTLDFVGGYPSVLAGTEVRFTVQMSLPGPGAGPVGESVAISAPGAGTCIGTLSSTLTASCSLTPSAASTSWPITATYAGNGTYGGASTQIIMRIDPAYVPPYCPYFESPILDFGVSPTAFRVNIINQDQYAMKISRIRVSWPTGGTTALLREIRFTDSNLIDTACNSNGYSQCIWFANNNAQALASGDPLTIDDTNNRWVFTNPGIPRNATRTLLFNFSTNLGNGPYSLSIDFEDNAGGTTTCTIDPEINTNR